MQLVEDIAFTCSYYHRNIATYVTSTKLEFRIKHLKYV